MAQPDTAVSAHLHGLCTGVCSAQETQAWSRAMATYLDRRAEVEAAYARGLRGLAEDKPREDKRWLFGMGVSTNGARIDSCQHLSSAVDAYNRVLASTRELADAHEELGGTIRRIKESTEKGTLRSQALSRRPGCSHLCGLANALCTVRSGWQPRLAPSSLPPSICGA